MDKEPGVPIQQLGMQNGTAIRSEVAQQFVRAKGLLIEENGLSCPTNRQLRGNRVKLVKSLHHGSSSWFWVRKPLARAWSTRLASRRASWRATYVPKGVRR